MSNCCQKTPNFWSWFSFLRDAGLRMYHYFRDFIFKKIWLKELYTSETTLAQKIVLTTLNNELKLKIWNSTSFMLKNRPIFLKKIYNNQFLASWRGPMVFMYINKVFYFHIKNIFVFILFETFAKNIYKNISKSGL